MSALSLMWTHLRALQYLWTILHKTGKLIESGKTISINIVQRKKQFSFSTGWQMREELTKVEASLSATSTICALITGDENLSLPISRDGTIKSGNKFLQSKVKLLLTEDEFCSFTHLVHYIEPFLQWRKQNVKISTQSLSSETLTDVEVPNWWRKW